MGPMYKGASLVVVRQSLRTTGREAQLLEAFTEDERDRYARTVATDWVPIAFAERVYAVAAPLLYPEAPLPVRALGREIARKHLNGIYKFALRFATVPFVVEQTARLWSMYNSAGRLTVVRTERQLLDFVLVEYPTYPAVVRESLAGYIVGTVELTGANNVHLQHDDADPNRWLFRVTWR